MKNLIILAAILTFSTAFAGTEDDIRTLGRGAGILMACGDDTLAEQVFTAGVKKGATNTKWTTQKTSIVMLDEVSETKDRHYTQPECKNFKHALLEAISLQKLENENI
jgi:hypothetical protein